MAKNFLRTVAFKIIKTDIPFFSSFYDPDQVLEEFYNIFGPELKAVTGDPKRIEDVLKRVDGLVMPIEQVSDVWWR